MTEILEEFRTAGRVHRLIFKNVEIENEKTFLDEIQLSLENTSLNDTRNFDETTETTLVENPSQFSNQFKLFEQKSEARLYGLDFTASKISKAKRILSENSKTQALS